MNGYLMDTNHVTAWEGQNPSLIAKVDSLPKNTTLIYASVITLGEISASHEITSGDAKRRHQVKQFLNVYVIPDALSISDDTPFYYGQIMGRIWQRHPPPNDKKRTEQHLVDLGVDINDVWIVAAAWEHGLIFLTTDKMPCIREAVSEVTFDTWL